MTRLPSRPRLASLGATSGLFCAEKLSVKGVVARRPGLAPLGSRGLSFSAGQLPVKGVAARRSGLASLGSHAGSFEAEKLPVKGVVARLRRLASLGELGRAIGIFDLRGVSSASVPAASGARSSHDRRATTPFYGSFCLCFGFGFGLGFFFFFSVGSFSPASFLARSFSLFIPSRTLGLSAC